MKLKEASLQLCQALAASYRQKGTLLEQDPALSLLQSAATCEDFAVTAAVCPFAFSTDGKRRRLALEALNQLPPITNDQLARFDAWFREECSQWFYPQRFHRHSTWYSLEPKRLSDLLRECGEQAHRPILLCICHPNGHVRQHALNLCAAANITGAVPYGLVRLNDWVAPVREAAARAINHWLASSESPNLLPVLPLVSRLSHCYRADHSKILRTMADYLQRGASQEQLLAGMQDPVVSVRSICYGMAMEERAPEELQRQAIEIGLNDPLAHLRMRAAKHAVQMSLDYSEQMLADRFMPIRRLGMEQRVKARTSDHRQLLEQSLDDPHRSMREFSRYWLKELNYLEDFASHYRQGLQDPTKRNRIAILGLGETGEASDCALIEPFLGHSAVRHREAAIRSLSALNFGDYRESIIQAVRDPSARVSRAATYAILASQVRLGADETTPLLAPEESDHTRLHALRLIGRLGKWEKIQCLLEAIKNSDRDSNTPHRLIDGTRQWLYRYNDSFAQPSSARLKKVNQLFESTKSDLPEGLRIELASLIESVG